MTIIPQNGQRVPLVKWKEDYADKGIRPSWQQLQDWFLNPKLQDIPNIAIICGALSGGLVVLDFEEEKAYLDFFTPEGTKKLELQTIVENTAHGGVHVWFKETGLITKRKVRIVEVPPIDILSEGLMTVTPSSTNHALCQKNNHCPKIGISEYRLRGSCMTILPRLNIEEALIKRAKELNWKLNVENGRIDIKGIVTKGVSQGNRNHSMFRMARALIFDMELDLEFAWLELKNINSRGQPPLPDGELELIFNQAKKYPKKKTEPGIFG